ncbi:related to SLY41 - Putative transporter of the triose phosphate translocator family [Ustilago trichophora]|uniref:Related to SLY41 - Putative transporter of the triose phosphate translocator family n=1 Tax=Ustilago trichophora TaxID=86804 RepID=A0A5C3E994_9BASI|nr:related to SLY41 - Putative transporter of the triose phosphate translocator family [Ustilago trichophora]
MNAALSSVRSRALEAVSQFSSSSSSSSSHTSLPTTTTTTSSSSLWRSMPFQDRSKRSFDRPRLFNRNRSDLTESSNLDHAHARSKSWQQATTAPSRSTLFFILGCLAWYTSSSLSSNTSKALLSKGKNEDHTIRPPAFPYPVTLTLIHFAFVNVCCFICASRRILGKRALTRLVKPSFSRVTQVGQLAFFNVLGQALSSLAISRVPVATVHTIKALSPLFTVLSYTYLFGITYSPNTYLSLFPLTLGVMMACTGFAFNADDIVGFSAALASTFVFVAQNIYSKKLLRKGENQAQGIPGTDTEKMDKINILFYSSGCSLILMIPMALFYDGASLVSHPSWSASEAYPYDRGMLVLWLLLCNGLVHFAQNILAFNVLSMVSPVTYSIASLLKRVFVIVLAIIWFHQPVSLLQWFGIALTFYGLWMYNDSKTKDDVSKVEKKVSRKQDDASLPQAILPLTSTSLPSASSLSNGVGLNNRPYPMSAPPNTNYHFAAAHQTSTVPSLPSQRYVPPQKAGGWNDVPESMLSVGKSYIKDPTKSLPSPPDSDKET